MKKILNGLGNYPEEKLIALYFQKLTVICTSYTVTEKTLLGIVENLKEFHTIIIFHKLIIFTNHNNITCNNFNNEKVLQWRLVLE